MEKKDILCPFCKGKVMSYDGKGTIPRTNRCRNCNLLVTYIPEQDRIKTKRPEERNCSSGVIFR